jgi:hypothetical protein
MASSRSCTRRRNTRTRRTKPTEENDSLPGAGTECLAPRPPSHLFLHFAPNRQDDRHQNQNTGSDGGCSYPKTPYTVAVILPHLPIDNTLCARVSPFSTELNPAPTNRFLIGMPTANDTHNSPRSKVREGDTQATAIIQLGRFLPLNESSAAWSYSKW